MSEVINHRSSFIAQTEYDRATGDLIVEFTDGKRVLYPDVPQGRYISFRSSASIGAGWHRFIKNLPWEDL